MNADRRSRAIARSAAVACALAVLLGLACDMGSDPPSTESQDALHDEPSGPLQPGDWLVLHLASDPENLNPLTSNDAGASSVLAWIFPPLVTLDAETLEQRPLLAAELPEISADHRTYTYRLRPGITFSDGTPLTAHDVVFTVKAIRHPRVNAPHARNYYESVRDVVALDDLTLRIELREVYFRNEWVLGAIQPIPRHYYDPHDLLAGIRVSELDDWEGLDPLRKDRALRFAKSFNEDFQRRPLGPGAYALEDPKRDFVTGERIVLRHRANHWAPGDTDLGDGWVDRVLFRVINDSEGALVAMKAGSLDVLGLRPLQHLKQTTSPRFTRHRMEPETGGLPRYPRAPRALHARRQAQHRRQGDARPRRARGVADLPGASRVQSRARTLSLRPRTRARTARRSGLERHERRRDPRPRDRG
jgi:peptide/nickel transport system substrate-binding protein